MLVIMVMLALLGDNPIQSKMACYIGLHSKFFCRVCWIKGCNVQDELNAILLPTISKSEEVNDAASILLGSTIDGHSYNGDSTSWLSFETNSKGTITLRSPLLTSAVKATWPTALDFDNTQTSRGPATLEKAMLEQIG